MGLIIVLAYPLTLYPEHLPMLVGNFLAVVFYWLLSID